MVKISLLASNPDDPAHRRVLSSLTREYRRAGHQVSGSGLLHLHYFSRAFRRPLPKGARLLLTSQGASPRFMDDPREFLRLALRADAVTAVSQAGRRDLTAAFPRLRGKIMVVNNGVDFQGKERALQRKRPYLLTLGRIAAYKGLDLLAAAFAAIADDFPHLDWIALGPDQTGGAFRDFVKRLGLKDRVLLPGAVSAEKAGAYLRGCRLFVLPSREEGMPLALLEAMAAGKPIVASRVGGVPEIMRHKAEGLLFPSGSVRALERALRRLLVEQDLGCALSSAARRRAEGFSWEAAARGYLRIFGGMTGVTSQGHGRGH